MFEWNNYKVTQIINITDIGHLSSDADEGEDKMMIALKRAELAPSLDNMRAVATKFIDAFTAEMSHIGNITPTS